jgi:hypothetical protein
MIHLDEEDSERIHNLAQVKTASKPIKAIMIIVGILILPIVLVIYLIVVLYMFLDDNI